MREARRPALWPVWALTVGMVAAAAGLFPALGRLPQLPNSQIALPALLLAAGFAIAEPFALQLRFRGEAEAYSVSEILLVVGLFAVAPLYLLAAAVFGFAVALAVQRATPLKTLFNVAQLALHVEVMVLVFRALAVSGDPMIPRNWLAVFVASLAGMAVECSAIAFAVSVAQGGFATRDLAVSLCWSVMCTSVNTMLGLVVVIVCAESMAAALLLVGPIGVVIVAYRAYVSEHAKSEGLQFLYRASEVLSNERDIESGLVALLDFARETFHTDFAEVVVLGEADESIGYRTCAGPGERRLRLEPCALEHAQRLVELASAAESAIVYTPSDDADLVHADGLSFSIVMAATLRDAADVRGVALVARQKGSGMTSFDKDEIRLFETFVKHLGTTLEKSRLSASLAQLRVLKQELTHQAYHDPLTGLANRLRFRDLVDIALAEAAHGGHRVAVLFIDLDDFKTVNDTMGHAAGDALLEEVARRIATSIGELGTAARLGGDEFAVLLPSVANDCEVRAVADRILVALGDPVAIEGHPVVAQASIGIASQVGSTDAAELMQHADVAMYTAKRNGKGRFDEFEPNMSLSVARRYQLKVGLERALAHDEFVLHYQPVIDAVRGAIIGTEALLRWKDPKRGLMPPTEFVGVAEETGLIVPIGRKVLFAACRQAAEWTPMAPDLRVFVNLSTRQLADPDLVADVANALSSAGLDPSHLVLEVTETAMMRDIDEAKSTLCALKELGVNLAIDDFGTGFSSLSYLRELPIDVLKVAKPIVDAICESDQDAAFVKGIIELGHVVGLQVVAEGVEQVEQYAHLVDMGCDFVQGYYYAPSMAAAEVTEILAVQPGIGTANVAKIRVAG